VKKPSLRRLRKFLSYDKECGALAWAVNFPGHRQIGREAGYVNAYGYRLVMFDGVEYMAGPLIWFYVTGKWPKHEIDHKNRIKHDNRLDNLREVTTSENHRNMPKSSRNTSGITGVYYCQRDDLWVADCKMDGARFRKSFKRKEDAIIIRSKWQAEFGYDPDHGLKGKYE